MAKFGIDLKTGKLSTVKEIIVGIDLGTTNSLIAYMDGDHPAIIPIGFDGNGILPSAIHLNEKAVIEVGHFAKMKRMANPLTTVYSIKRLLGRTMEDLQENQIQLPYPVFGQTESGYINILLKDKVYSPIELSSYILKELKAEAEFILKQNLQKAVITVPAYFSDAQRQATRAAGEMAGFEVLRIVNEPTAASMAYGIGLNRDLSQNIMVYDFGGGTFDVSILRIEDGIFEVLATNGDNLLGGDDIDEAILKYWMHELALPQRNPRIEEMRTLAEEAKKHLSTNDIFEKDLPEFRLKLSAQELTRIALPFIERSLICCKKAIQDSHLQVDEIDEVVLVGGTTRLKDIKTALSETFHRPINDSIDPDQVVALGAAIQADILSGNRKDFLLLDVTPLSMGIETMGGLMDNIIPRNSKIPLKLAKQYTTSKDGQKNIRIAVYQGEREFVKDNIKLGEFILTDIDPMPAGLPRIELIFSLDVDGILSVTAKEMRSQKEQSIEIKSSFKLDQEEIAKRLMESVKMAQADMELKATIDASNEANYILLNARKFLVNNEMYLSPSEIEMLRTHILLLENSLTSNSAHQIHESIEKFNLATTEIAQKIMDIQIHNSLTGNSIDKLP